MKLKIKVIAALAVMMMPLFLASCSDDDIVVSPEEQALDEQISKMTLREKIGQMFFVRLSALDPTQSQEEVISATKHPMYELTDQCVEFNKDYPCGGVILFAKNIKDPEQLTTLTARLHSDLKNSPLISVDEEGGRVARIANTEGFNLEKHTSTADITESGNLQDAYDWAKYIGTYVANYGFDIDYAPVADVNTNPENIVIGRRAFSDDPQIAASYVVKYLEGLQSTGVTGCLKHFPGHGDVAADTHTAGYVASQKTWEELSNCEMITFRAGIANGAKMVMTAHVAVPNVDATLWKGNAIPSTMSKVVLQDILRGKLGFQGVIVTDAMDMGAITLNYTPAEAAVKTIQAGVDVVLCPQNYRQAFDAVLAAVQKGEISEERINQSVKRILKLKK